MLDSPVKAPAPRVEPAPISSPAPGDPGVWTQTFASLATSKNFLRRRPQLLRYPRHRRLMHSRSRLNQGRYIQESRTRRQQVRLPPRGFRGRVNTRGLWMLPGCARWRCEAVVRPRALATPLHRRRPRAPRRARRKFKCRRIRSLQRSLEECLRLVDMHHRIRLLIR